MSEVVGFALTLLALALLIFGLGASLGFSWAVKSLDVAPPRWIAGVLLVAGLSFVVAAILNENLLLAAGCVALFGTIVAGTLRIGPFRSPSRSE